MQEYCIWYLRNIWFGYLLELPQWGNSNKYPKHMIYEEKRTKQDLSYISICSLRILFNGNFILMATAFGTNAVFVLRVHSSSVTQVWSITLHFIHHPWDNWLTKRRFLWIFITPGNTSIANQNVANIALLSSAEDSFVLLPLLKLTQENPINVFVSN